MVKSSKVIGHSVLKFNHIHFKFCLFEKGHFKNLNLIAIQKHNSGYYIYMRTFIYLVTFDSPPSIVPMFKCSDGAINLVNDAG